MNKSGCKDPTAELAIGRVTHKQKLPRDVKAFDKIVEGLAVLHGFTVLKPAVIRDRMGKVYQ